MKAVLSTLWNHILLIFGWFIVLAGIVITPLPIPLGLAMIIAGLSLLTLKSQYLRNQLRLLRKKYRVFSSQVRRITPNLPRLLRKAVELTDPDHKE